jgi:hypothetical protein
VLPVLGIPYWRIRVEDAVKTGGDLAGLCFLVSWWCAQGRNEAVGVIYLWSHGNSSDGGGWCRCVGVLVTSDDEGTHRRLDGGPGVFVQLRLQADVKTASLR